MPHSPAVGRAARFAGVAAAYFLASLLGAAFVVQPEQLAVFWPAGGLLLGYLFVQDRRRWADIVLAAFVGNLAANLVFGHSHAVAGGFAAVNAVEPLAIAWTIGRFRDGPFRLHRIADLFWLFAAPFAVCAGTAAVGAGVVTVGLGAPSYWAVWKVWWVSAALGAILFAPLVLAWATSDRGRPWSRARVAEVGAVLALLAAVVWAIFVSDLHQLASPLAMSYPVFPVLLWVSFRTGLRGTSAAVALTGLIVAWGTLQGGGPVGDLEASVTDRVLIAQGFSAVVGLISLLLATAFRERRAAETALRASEERFRAIFHSQFQFIGLLSPAGVVLDANRGALAAAGVPTAAVLGKPFWDTPWWTHDAAQQDRLRAAVRRAAAGDQDRFEASHPLPAGGLIWVDFYLTPFRDESGRVALLIPEGRDITARKAAEEALADSEERFRAAMEGSLHAVFFLAAERGPDGAVADFRFAELNGRGAALVARPREDVIGRRLCELLPVNRTGGFFDKYARVVATGEPLEEEFPIAQADGIVASWLHHQVVRVGDGVVITSQDITDRKLAEEALREAAAFSRGVLDALSAHIAVVDADGVITAVNRAWERFAAENPTADEVAARAGVGTSYLTACDRSTATGCADARLTAAAVRAVLAGVRPWAGLEYECHAPGERRWFAMSVTPLGTTTGGAVISHTNVSARKLAEESVQETESRFRSAFEDAAVGMALVGLDGRWLRVNRSVCQIVGYGEAELLATDFQTLTHPADLDAGLDFVRQLLAGTLATFQMEKRYFHKDGHPVWVLLAVSLVRGGDGRPLYFVSQIQDITERTRAEEQVRASLREKEVLLKEIHHRVKNNLQIVSTLLDLQSEHTADAAARVMFEESRGRVRSMALIHERLYRSTDLARVDFAEYIRQLADDLYRTYKVSGADIRLDLAVDVPPLPLDLAIPCGLLLNELMSNCFKHAFPAAAEGCIRVDLRPAADGTNVLTVADDGAGFPAGTDFRNTHSFGLQLVNTLVEQLDGEIALSVAAGTTFTVRFPTTKGQPPDRTPAP